MPARGAVTLFRIRGIRIGIDYSWFFVLFLIIFWLSGFYRSILDAPDGAIGPYALAVASALAFFGSILLHELGHAFVAIRRGNRDLGHHPLDVRRRRSDDQGLRLARDRVQDRHRRAAGHPRHRPRMHRRGDRSDGQPRLLAGDEGRAPGAHLRDPGARRLARQHQHPDPGLQPDSRPSRSTAEGSRARSPGSSRATATARPAARRASARASPTSSSRLASSRSSAAG